MRYLRRILFAWSALSWWQAFLLVIFTWVGCIFLLTALILIWGQ
jgi:hypothetical protein